jgi:hypothetical protein
VISAFPLAWPDGYARAKHRKDSPYKVSTEVALTDLLDELRLMGAKHVIVSSNVPLRRDGTMYRGDHSESAMPDPGVAVYWDTKDGRPLVAPFDGWRTVRENVRAVGLTIAAFRAIERAGAIQLLERAYTGFARLPAPADCWKTLGLDGAALRQALPELSRAAVNAAHRNLARHNHPDHGGSTDQMSAINTARDEALRQIGAGQ